MVQAELGQHPVGGGVGPGAQAVGGGDHPYVLRDGEVGKALGAVEEQPDVPPEGGVRLARCGPREADLAPVRLLAAHADAQQGRLAGAVGTGESQTTAGLQGQGDVGQDGLFGVGDVDVLCVQQGGVPGGVLGGVSHARPPSLPAPAVARSSRAAAFAKVYSSCTNIPR